jgi:hypothetical protein
MFRRFQDADLKQIRKMKRETLKRETLKREPHELARGSSLTPK